MRFNATDAHPWLPIRRGPIYCSPACGGRCTWAAYCEAIKCGDLLAAKLSFSVQGSLLLLGSGWTSRVWENLGWHYSVMSPCGRISVRANQRGDHAEMYTALLHRQGSNVAEYVENGKTPEAAIENVIEVARTERDKISAMLEGLC